MTRSGLICGLRLATMLFALAGGLSISAEPGPFAGGPKLEGTKFTVSWFDLNGDRGALRFHFREDRKFTYEALPQGFTEHGVFRNNPGGDKVRFVATVWRGDGSLDTLLVGVVRPTTKKISGKGQGYNQDGKVGQEFYFDGEMEKSQ
ncbi:MAG: hypothetical protein FJ290_12030 [Planctomycetes bacterium]|nr:hypothetical protein [Planctomycetota bacterium]